MSLAIFIIIVGFPVFIILIVLVFIDLGSPFFIQKRVGFSQYHFNLIKFRTMKVGTASVGTHLADKNSITKLGKILRKSKLDELPQLFNVLLGHMSIVGPRPCLTTQVQLIQRREELNVFSVKPGITGLAQLKGIDMSTPSKLAKVDRDMIDDFSLFNYFKYIIMTFLGKGSGDRIV